MCLRGKFSALLGEISGSQQRDVANEGWAFSRVNESKFYMEFHISAKRVSLLGGLARFHANTTLIDSDIEFTIVPPLIPPRA